jgi:diguanylate cyclase (GGDEF)-like protein
MSLANGDAKVLVVDDSAVVRAVVSSCLKRAGYDVAMADSGSAALERLSETSFDVVITDLNMPGMSGIEMLRRIRLSQPGPEVIILTGSGAQDVSSAVEALRLGAHDFLTKPPKSAEVIVCAVEKALEKKRLQDENARLLESLQALSLTDSLTGLPNRRAFDEAFAEARAVARHQGTTLSIVILDIDHFKRINDTFGHPGGDAVLKHVASTAAGVLGAGEVLYRIGGEEFAAILPSTAPTSALEGAALILNAVATTPVPYQDAEVRVTSSAGIASASGEDDRDLVAEADAALYAAKRAGRNRVFLPIQSHSIAH